MPWKFLSILVFAIEVLLSHTPGEASGNQSRWLSSMTGVKESLLRRAAHVILFSLLSFTAGQSWSWLGIIGVCIWSVLDELTKVWIPGRHCGGLDVFLNLIGSVTGTVLWLS